MYTDFKAFEINGSAAGLKRIVEKWWCGLEDLQVTHVCLQLAWHSLARKLLWNGNKLRLQPVRSTAHEIAGRN